MWFTYNLLSLKDNSFYTGYTDNIQRRIEEHNTGKGGNYTAKKRPFELVHYEAFITKEEAMAQEDFYKSGYGKEVLKKKIKKTLELLNSKEKK